MKILIIGAGAVGFSIAKQLSAEGHDISVVDVNPKLIRKISEKLDVSVITGKCYFSQCIRICRCTRNRYGISRNHQ